MAVTNPYYEFAPAFVPGTKARSGDVNAEFLAVQAAFDYLPASASAITRGTATIGVESGSGNTFVVTMPDERSTNQEGDLVTFRATHSNTGAITLNVDGLGAVSARHHNDSELAAGDIVSGRYYTFRYDATLSRFVMTADTLISNQVSFAAEWANKAEDSLVSVAAGGDGVDDYSALHWARKAESFAAGIGAENVSFRGEHSAFGGTAPTTPTDRAMYRISIPGTFGSISWRTGDYAIWDGAAWQKLLPPGASRSVLGVAGSSGDYADIISTANNTVLKRLADTLLFAQVVYADIANASAMSVLGRATNSAGVLSDIQAGSDNQVLRRNGTTVAFGAINLASSNAVTGDLPFTNIAQVAGPAVVGVTSASTADIAAIQATTNDRLLRRTSDALSWGQLTAGMFPSAVVPDAALSSNIPRRDVEVELTAAYNTASNLASLALRSTSPGVEFYDSNASAAARRWFMYAAAGSFYITTLPDSGAGTGTTTAFRVVRSGTNVASVDLFGAAISLNTTSATITSGVGANGDAVLTIEADTDDAVESSTPYIHFLMDGGASEGVVGMTGAANTLPTGSALTGVPANSLTFWANNNIVVAPTSEFIVRSAASGGDEASRISFGATSRGQVGYFGFDDLQIRNYVHGGSVHLIGEDAGGVTRVMLNADPDGTMQFSQIGTTGSGANAFLDSGNGNNLLRSTSSARYKKDIEDMRREDIDSLLSLRPVQYRSTSKADNPDRLFYGFIAEEVAAVDPRWVNYLDGKPDGVQYDRIVVGLVGLVKELREELDSLKKVA